MGLVTNCEVLLTLTFHGEFLDFDVGTTQFCNRCRRNLLDEKVQEFTAQVGAYIAQNLIKFMGEF
jgi:hypothetical protein